MSFDSGQIQGVFADHGIGVQVTNVQRGPVLSVIELAIGRTVKVAQVVGLSEELRMALEVASLRMYPSRNRIAVEVSNPERADVSLFDLIELDAWRAHAAKPLPFVVGVDVMGVPAFSELSEAPHILVAGATGSGKSVGLNGMIVSLLAAKSPADLRLVMIDPKYVELAVYGDVPHLVRPIANTADQAISALEWCIEEMERRYPMLAAARARNIESYNARARVALPRVVVVIDEVADLLTQADKPVRARLLDAMSRLLAKARAAGIHVVIATQRPSVDVVNGVIKSNLPSRIAYKVSSDVDSRVILDEDGAEKLLGRGDMLARLAPGAALTRYHGAYVSEEEVTDFCELLSRVMDAA